jgi:hypothetical protein
MPINNRGLQPLKNSFIQTDPLPRLCSTLLSDTAARRSHGASLSLLLHQNVKATSTTKLLNMLGTHSKGRTLIGVRPLLFFAVCATS